MFSVRDRVSDNILQKDLEDSSSFFVNEARDALHSTATGETTNRRLGNALDIVTKDLAMALGPALSESLTSLAAT